MNKKFIAVAMAGVVALSLSACVKSSPETEEQTTNVNATQVTTQTEKDTTTVAPELDIKAEYLAKLNEECKTNNVIYNAYFYMNKGGNPILAYSNITEYDTWPTPDHVYQYINGEIVESSFPTESGSAAKQDLCFVEGTNTMVFRYLGNSGGTLGNASQDIYIFDDEANEYKVISKEFTYEGDIVHYGNPTDSDYRIIQSELVEEMNKMLEENIGADYKLISYNENMVTIDCADYLEGMLGGEVNAENYVPEN